MKKRYIIPAIKTVFISLSRNLLIVGQSYKVNNYENGNDYTIGGEEDEDNQSKHINIWQSTEDW